jgi:hypothetical protein
MYFCGGSARPNNFEGKREDRRARKSKLFLVVFDYLQKNVKDVQGARGIPNTLGAVIYFT